MEEKHYTVSEIKGEYAILKDVSDGSGEGIFIALALLPEGTDIGSRLKYFMFEYTLEK